MGGIRVTLLSRSADGVAQGLEKARAQGGVLTVNGLAETAEVERALELLGGSTDFDESVAGADLVVESGPEDSAGSASCLPGWTLWRGRRRCWHPIRRG